MAGYAFAKLNFKGKNFLFSIVLMQMMLPSQIFILPQYQMVAKLGFANTIAGCKQFVIEGTGQPVVVAPGDQVIV